MLDSFLLPTNAATFARFELLQTLGFHEFIQGFDVEDGVGEVLERMLARSLRGGKKTDVIARGVYEGI